MGLDGLSVENTGELDLGADDVPSETEGGYSPEESDVLNEPKGGPRPVRREAKEGDREKKFLSGRGGSTFHKIYRCQPTPD